MAWFLFFEWKHHMDFITLPFCKPTLNSDLPHYRSNSQSRTVLKQIILIIFTSYQICFYDTLVIFFSLTVSKSFLINSFISLSLNINRMVYFDTNLTFFIYLIEQDFKCFINSLTFLLFINAILTNIQLNPLSSISFLTKFHAFWI